MPAGYSGTPLWKKLGFKEGFIVRTLNAPDVYSTLLTGHPNGVIFSKKETESKDLIHIFTKSEAELTVQLPALKNEIKQNRNDLGQLAQKSFQSSDRRDRGCHP